METKKMANEQNARFTQFAGQLVASGVGKNSPLVGLEDTVNETVLANLQKIHGLIPKITDVFVRETRIFSNPLSPHITVFNNRYGAGMEQVAFKIGAYNEKRDGTCFPKGVPDVASQLDLVNFAYSVDVAVYDRMVDRAMMNDEQVGAFVAQLLRTPLKTIATLKYRAWVQLLSDVIDGTRDIDSYTASNGVNAPAGVSVDVDYEPTITGYAGVVENRSEVIPLLEVGVRPVINTPLDALNICNELKARASDFMFESKVYNKLQIDTFSTGVPLLIMEKKVLDAMDTVFAEANAKGNGNNFGYAGFPTVSARDYLREFAELVEIDCFGSIPTNASYAGRTLHAVLIDRDAFIENVKYADAESMRCAKERATGTNWQGESILSIWRGVNSYAMLFRAAGEVTFESGNFTIKAGETSVTTGDDIAPGTVLTVKAAASYDLTAVTVNGDSVALNADNTATIVMPYTDAVIAVTTAAE